MFAATSEVVECDRGRAESIAMWGLLRQATPTGLFSAVGTTGIFSELGSVRGFKVVAALRRRCRDCRMVKRGKKIYVLCDANPRHKQRQGKGGSVYRPS